MRTKGQISSFRIKGMVTVSVAALSLACLSSPASAQLNQQTGIADPSRAGEQLSQPDMAPRVEPEVSVKRAPAVSAPAGAEKITFVLKAIQVEGASAYSDEALRSVYADRLGKTQSLADVYEIANALTSKYRNDGYILTQVVVPPQTIENGTATVRVVEGFVDDIKIQKADEASRVNIDGIKAYAAHLNRGGPLNTRELERELLLINDLPGVRARSILSPSPTVAGAADLLIIVEHDPLDGVVSFDNFGSRYLGPIQLGGAVQANSLLGMNEAISAQVVVAPQNWYELAYGALGYEQAVGNAGTKLRVSASVTDTDPGYNLKQFDVEGRSYLLSFGASHPFIRSRSENLTGRLSFDLRRVKSSNNIENTRRDRITALRAGGRYEFLDSLFNVAANTVDVEVSKGLNILGANDEGDRNMSRSEGDPQFTKMEAEIQRLQRLTGSVNLLLAGRGQWASNALLSSEEFGIGGVNLGRGYDPSEIVGDEGLAGKVELQWKDPLKLDPRYVNSYQFYGFYDIGVVWNDDATTAALKKQSLASVGAGVRFDLPLDLEGGFAVAFPLTRDVATEKDKDPRFYVNLSKKF